MITFRNINELAANLLSPSRLSNDQGIPSDGAWIRQAFIVRTTKGRTDERVVMLNAVDAANREYCSASFKYTDSSLGGNFCINPPPQFTRYCDPPVKGFRKQAIDTGIAYSAGVRGMGQYYSEAIDDNNHIVHLSFGFPSYNSLTQFFTGFYNDSAATMARTGRNDKGLIDKFIKLAFNIINLAILPLTIIPILFMAVGNAVTFFLKMPASKFYYFKEGMAIYWQVVNNIVNNLAVNQRLVTYTQPTIYEAFMGEKPKTDAGTKTIFHQIFPEMAADGIIDVYAIANKSKRMQERNRKAVFEQLLQTGDSGWYGKVRKVYATDAAGASLEQIDPRESIPWTQRTFFEKWIGAAELGVGDAKGAIEQEMRVVNQAASNLTGDKSLAQAKVEKYVPNPSGGFMDYYLASAADGSRYASFRVDGAEPISESFSNSTAASSLAEKLNSTSQSAREIRVSYAEGNVDPAGFVSGILSGAQSIVTNAADVLHLGGLASFAGRAFVDIPEHWTSHSANIASEQSYTMTLTTPYGNPVSRMMHIYVPLCMLIAGTLPLATGKQSYTSPFLCQLYDRGRCITRLGIISSLTITRGTANLAWDRDGMAMSIDVSFTVKDLSTVVALPIHEGFSTMPLDGIFDSESKYTDYLMALSGLSLQEVTDPLPILKRQLDMKWVDIKQYFSSSRWAMQMASTLPGQITAAFMSGTDKK
jgi:hypothetical protein